MEPDNEGSPYLYEGGQEYGRRSEDRPNPNQWESHENPNAGVLDIPQVIDDPTALEWMD